MLSRVSSHDHVVDLGCGTGRFTIPLARHAASTTGLDLTPEMLEQLCSKAESVGVQVSTRCGDMADLPFDDCSFDVAVSMLALMHVPLDQRQDVFAEIARVLKPGGRLIVGVKNGIVERFGQRDRFATVDVTDVQAGELVFTDTGTAQAPRAPWHSFTPDELTRLVSAAGMLPTTLKGNIPISAWLSDELLANDAVRASIGSLENAVSDIPPFSHLGYYLLFEAVKPGTAR